MKAKLLGAVAAVALTVTTVSFAATPGAYVGASTGLGVINTPDSWAYNWTGGSQEQKRERGGAAFRVKTGYNINKNFGVEAGYLRPAKSEYKSNGSSLKFTDNIFDIAAKGYLPLANDRIDLFGKVGLAYVSQKVKYNPVAGQSIDTSHFAQPKTGSKTYSAVRPEIGGGVNINFTKNIAMDVSVTHIQGRGDIKNSRSAIADVNYVGVGLQYTF